MKKILAAARPNAIDKDGTEVGKRKELYGLAFALKLGNHQEAQEDKNMDNLFVFIIMGLFLYLIFFRKGWYGMLGGHTGHGDHGQVRPRGDEPSGESINDAPQKEVIELREDQYAILNPNSEKPV